MGMGVWVSTYMSIFCTLQPIFELLPIRILKVKTHTHVSQKNDMGFYPIFSQIDKNYRYKCQKPMIFEPKFKLQGKQ